MNQKHFFTDGIKLSWDYDTDFTCFEAINSQNFPVAFFSVIGIMSEDCDYHINDCYSQRSRLFFRSDDSELMLRYGSSELVVARIEFVHKRAGNMTRLFEVLKHIKQIYNLDKIVIESVQSNEMKAWCKKNNFIPCGDPDSFSINWEYK